MVAIPDPGTFQVMPWRTGEYKVARMICDVVTPGREAVRGRSALRAEAGARADDRAWASRPSTSAPSSSTSTSRTTTATEILDHGGYFDLTTLDAASEWRKETIKALESMGIPVEYAHHEVAPSQHEIDMRYASRARDGRPHGHLSADRQGDRDEVRDLRDVHAEAAVRRERLRHAHPSVALRERQERVLRRRRRMASLADGQALHRRAFSTTPARSARSSPSG